MRFPISLRVAISVSVFAFLGLAPLFGAVGCRKTPDETSSLKEIQSQGHQKQQVSTSPQTIGRDSTNKERSNFPAGSSGTSFDPIAAIQRAVAIGINRIPLDSLEIAVSDLEHSLKILDDSAIATVNQMAAARSESLKDSIFVRFVRQREDVEPQFSKTGFSLPEYALANRVAPPGWPSESEVSHEKRARLINSLLHRHGLEIHDTWQMGTGTWGDQGEFEVLTPARWYDSLFSTSGSPALKEYLGLVRFTAAGPTDNDLYLYTGRKAARWEMFRNRNPGFIDIFGMEWDRAIDIQYLFMGSENDGISDASGKARTVILTAYRKIITEHPETQLAKSLKKWLEKIETPGLCIGDGCSRPFDPRLEAKEFMFQALGKTEKSKLFPGNFYRGSVDYFKALGLYDSGAPKSRKYQAVNSW